MAHPRSWNEVSSPELSLAAFCHWVDLFQNRGCNSVTHWLAMLCSRENAFPKQWNSGVPYVQTNQFEETSQYWQSNVKLCPSNTRTRSLCCPVLACSILMAAGVQSRASRMFFLLPVSISWRINLLPERSNTHGHKHGEVNGFGAYPRGLLICMRQHGFPTLEETTVHVRSFSRWKLTSKVYHLSLPFFALPYWVSLYTHDIVV